MQIKQALVWGYNQIKNKETKTAALDAEVLLAFVIKKSKEYVYIHSDKKLTKLQQLKFETLIAQRTKFEPIAYLINKKEFFNLSFYVDHHVLIPRPETELLIETVIQAAQDQAIVIADVGTGSGCIAISLAKNLTKSKILAVDISNNALLIAKKNARINQAKISFYLGNLLTPIKNNRINIVVANLPYLDSNYKNLLNSNNAKSLKFEPALALKAGKFGLAVYEKLFFQINKLTYQPELIFCEIGHTHRKELVNLIKKILPNYQWQIQKDLAKKNRILILKKDGLGDVSENILKTSPVHVIARGEG